MTMQCTNVIHQVTKFNTFQYIALCMGYCILVRLSNLYWLFLFETFYHFVFLSLHSLWTSTNMLLKGKRAFICLTPMALSAYIPLCVLLHLLHDYFCMLVRVFALFLRTYWIPERSRAACACVTGASAQRPIACFCSLSSCCCCVTAMNCSFASCQ